MTDEFKSENFQIGDFLVEADRLRIVFNGKVFQVEPLIMKVLCILEKHAGDVVRHDVLVNSVWGSEHGTHERLVRAISILRKTFREGGATDGFIETIPKRGYRLKAEAIQREALKENKTESNEKAQDEIPFDGIKTKRPIFSSYAVGLPIVCVLVFGLWLWNTQLSERHSISEQATTTIAVLPFVPLSNEEGLLFFAKGYRSELLAALNAIPKLTIISSDSEAGVQDPIVKNADYTLKGAVEETDNQFQVFVQLTRVSSQQQLWSETIYRRKQIPTLKMDIAQEVSRSLQARLGVGLGKGRTAAGNIDSSAYEHYLRGVALWPERSNPDARRKAITSLRLAVSKQTDFADAWARYGVALVLSLPEMSGLSVDEVDQEAFTALQRALELDADNVRAHIGSAAYFLRRTIETKKAEEHALKAIALDAGLAESHYILAMTYLAQGRYQEAHRAFDLAIANDPDNAIPRNHKMYSLASKGDLSALQALINDCGRCTDPGYTYLEFIAAIQQGSAIRSEEMINKYLESVERYIAAGGSREDVSVDNEFNDIIEIFVNKKGLEMGWRDWMTDAPPSILMASAYAHIGEYKKAIEMIEQMVEHSSFLESFELVSHEGYFAFPKVFTESKEYQNIWATPAMNELLEIRRLNQRRIGLPINNH